MIQTVDFHIPELQSMKKYPKELFYIGDIELLKRKKISIVGTRKPNQYTKQYIYTLAKSLSNSGFVIVSGAAMGVDAVAHEAAGTKNTIAVAGTGLDIRYPAINKKLIEKIEKDGLMLSQFPPKTQSRGYHFPLRNETVVALGEILIVAQADLQSGTMHSVEFARKMGKKIFVLPHRIGESDGTNSLLKKNEAEAIFSIEDFVASLGGEKQKTTKSDPIENYFATNPTYDEAMKKYPSELFEYELSGKLKIKNGVVQLICN
jgi:DNA processing protein